MIGVRSLRVAKPARVRPFGATTADVSTANEDWRPEYEVNHSRFFFASGSYSRTENIGYFLTADNHVEGYLRGGNEIAEWGAWEPIVMLWQRRAVHCLRPAPL